MATDHAREFTRLFETLCRRYDRHRVFLDWLTLTSSAILDASSPWHREEAQKTYAETLARYNDDERPVFPKLFGIATAALESEFQDFLGHVYMWMELGNKHQGQFFTPYELSKVTAAMMMGDIDPDREFITLQEPACGSGGMVIAAMEVLRDAGINYQTQTYTLAVDVSEMAARMAYIQLSIIGCPAQVILGNTLSLETRACWPTMFYGRVVHKLARHRRQQVMEATPPPPPEPNVRPPFPHQLAFEL